MESWVEKYRPKTVKEVAGREQEGIQVREFVEKFPNVKRKALILYGPAGTGKTSIVYALAKDVNAEIFELNASDLRNKKKLQEILDPASKQQSLLKKNKIILIDEIDGISRQDYGGISEVVKIVNETSCPIIMTANDIWDSKFSPLRKTSQLIELKDLDYRTIKQVLISVLRKENKFLSLDILTKIAAKSKGDLRAAINDLQTAADMEKPEEIFFDERNKKTDVFNVLKQILKGKPSNETLRAFDSIDMDLDEIMLWMEKNVVYEYKGEELARAYDLISKADLFRGRIYKKQYWRFLAYENIFLSYGVASSKKYLKSGFTRYKKPTRILKMWMNNQKTGKKKSICKKYARYVHVGYKRAMSEYPIVKQILNSNEKIAKELNLSDEEREYLKQ